MGSTNWKGDLLFSGYHTHIGGKEVELDNQVKQSQLPALIGIPRGSSVNSSIDSKELQSPSVGEPPVKVAVSPIAKLASTFVTPTSFYGTPVKKRPKGPLWAINCCHWLSPIDILSHDPEAESAVVMKAPTKEHIKRFNKKYAPDSTKRYSSSHACLRNLDIVPVVLDPVLSRRMRPHQTEGKFNFIPFVLHVPSTQWIRRQVHVRIYHGLTKTWRPRLHLGRRDVSWFVVLFNSLFIVESRGLGKTLQVRAFIIILALCDSKDCSDHRSNLDAP